MLVPPAKSICYHLFFHFLISTGESTMNIASSTNYIFLLPAGIKHNERRQDLKSLHTFILIFSLWRSLGIASDCNRCLSIKSLLSACISFYISSVFIFILYFWSAGFCPWACRIDFQATPWKLPWWKGMNDRMRGNYFSSYYGALIPKLLG